jgi:selenocysteine-specific elongation factor
MATSRSLVVGTAGHIDHGKSTLVRALTGIDPDRLKEEKARGITIDLGFAHADVGDVHVAFVDVPGHERFVKNMLAGIGGIDAVLLVIAADESVMPQTREHFDICRLLRVPEGVIALTKADAVDADTLELTMLETRELVAGTFLESAPVVPVSAKTGAGLDGLRAALAALGRHGAAGATERSAGGVRMPIDRVFSMRGFGTVVTGTLVSGVLRQDAELVVAPAGRRVKVRALQVHGRPTAEISAGHRVAVNLGGIEVGDVERGEMLITPDALEPTRRFDAVVELLPSARALRNGARVRFHHGTAELLGRVTLAAGNELEPGARVYARLRLESPTLLTRGDRFILRAYSPSVTIGGGEVLDPAPPRGGARTEAGRRRFDAIAPDVDLDLVAARMVGEAGAAGLPAHRLAARAGLAPAAAAALVTRLDATDAGRDLGGLVVACDVLDALARDALSDVEQHHRQFPLSEGLPREELRSRRFSRAAPPVFEFVLERLAQKIVGRDRLALSSHRVELSGDEQRARERIEQTYRDGALKPPVVGELPGLLELDAALVDRIVKLLTRQRILVRVEDLLFHADSLARLKADVQQLKASGQAAKVDVAAFKERFGITRKFAIPLLEYLDRERITRRVGETRVVL